MLKKWYHWEKLMWPFINISKVSLTGRRSYDINVEYLHIELYNQSINFWYYIGTQTYHLRLYDSISTYGHPKSSYPFFLVWIKTRGLGRGYRLCWLDWIFFNRVCNMWYPNEQTCWKNTRIMCTSVANITRYC